MKIFKKIVCSILVILALTLTLSAVGCNNGGGAPGPELSIDKTSFNIYVLETETLTVETESEEIIYWSLTNEAVATLTVSEDGKTATVLGISKGETTVMAKQGKSSVSCKVMIFPAQEVLAVSITSPLTLNLKVGDNSQLNTAVTYGGEEFSDATLEFKVAQESPLGCLTVNESGLVTAVKQGVATVMVRANFGEMYSEWDSVTVYVFPEDYNNDDQKAPNSDGCYIEDVFGGWEI